MKGSKKPFEWPVNSWTGAQFSSARMPCLHELQGASSRFLAIALQIFGLGHMGDLIMKPWSSTTVGSRVAWKFGRIMMSNLIVPTGNHPQLIPSEKRWVGLQCFRACGIQAGEIQYPKTTGGLVCHTPSTTQPHPFSPQLCASLRRLWLPRRQLGELLLGGLQPVQAEGWTAPASASDFRVRAAYSSIWGVS